MHVIDENTSYNLYYRRWLSKKKSWRTKEEKYNIHSPEPESNW